MLQTDFSWFFREKDIVRRAMEVHESWTPCFFVLIPTSTTVLNDMVRLQCYLII